MKKTIIALMALAGVAIGADAPGYSIHPQYKNDVTFTGNEGSIKLSEVPATWSGDGSIYWGGANSSIDLTVDGDFTPYRIKTDGNSTIESLTLTFVGESSLNVYDSDSNFAFTNVETLNINFGTGGIIQTTRNLDLGGNSIVMNFTSETALDNLDEGLYSRTLISSANVWYSTGAIEDDRITLSDALLDAAGYTYKGVYYADADGVLYTGVTKDGYGTVTGVDKNTSVGSLKAGEYALVMTNNATSYGLMANIVPEPTTATLSLLALAGLAARRRRK